MKAVGYDLRTMPASYDVLTFLVVAKSKGVDHILFMPEFGPNRKPYSVDEKQFRLTHILYPMCSLMGLSYTIDSPKKLAMGYMDWIKWSDKPHFLCEALKEYKNNSNLHWPQPSERAKEIVQKEFPEPPVVITLRETYTEGRNSNIREWEKFGIHVFDSNDVVFVRDTSRWSELLNGEDFLPTFPIASIDLDIRLALYQHAKINFSVGGGPTILLHYSQDIPYRTFKMAYDGYKSSSVDFLTEMGFPPGSQFPWHTENQKVVWEEDTFENLKREYDKWISGPVSKSRIKLTGEN